MSMYELDGQPMTSDPRHALQRQVDALAAEGLYPAGAFELEFFLLANDRDAEGRVQPARDVLDGRASAKTEVYSVDHLHGMLPLFSDIYAAAGQAGITAETMISEYAPGQYELTLHYRTDVMQAADDLMRLKRIVRLQARQHGVTACFMAKPFEGYAGSGMHFHVSMLDAGGKNVFVEAVEGRWSETILHALGGLRETMGESMLVFAPHANSWRRFAASPTRPSARPGASTTGPSRCAFRPATSAPGGSSIDPRASTPTPTSSPRRSWRASATACPTGLTRAPRPPATAMKAAADAPPIPVDWRSAIEAAEGSAFLKDALGADMHRTFTAIKAAEYARVARTVSEVDYDLYLHTV